MNSDRLVELFERARGLEASEREELVRETQAENAELGEILRRLLGQEGASLAERIQDKYGPDADPHISLEGNVESEADFTSEVVQRLAGRGEAYGRYRLRGEVARGGQGAILRVWDEDLRRNLAMKVVLGSGDAEKGDTPDIDSRTLGRFLEEAQVTGQLDHPGIVPVHELGLDSRGQVYFTMKLVKGEDLRSIFEMVETREDGWSLTRALGVMLKVCEAMAYAHAKGVIHRDLKPANVMVGKFGEVYVMDWGLARVLGEDDQKDIRLQPAPAASQSVVRTDRHDDSAADSPLVTMDGDVVGTPAYMSPEQARGDLAAMGPASDVYSAGAMLYHLIAGHMPYAPRGSKLNAYAILGMLQNGPPTVLATIARGSSEELVAICERAMAREITERYPDMAAMAEDLQAYVEGRVVKAHRTGAVVELKKWVRRNRLLAATGALAVVLGVVAILVFGFADLQRRSLRSVQAEQELTLRARDVALENEHQALRNAERAWREGYAANVIAANASLDANEIREGKRCLEETREELRGWEWRYLRLKSDSSVRAFAGHEAPVLDVAYRADGERIASASADGAVRLWDPVEGSEVAILGGHEGEVVSVAFEADGHLLRSIGALKMRTWNGTTGELVGEVPLPARPASPVVTGADGELLAFASAGNAVHVVEAVTGQPRLVLEVPGGAVRALAFGPGPGRLLTGGDDGSVLLCSLETGEVERSITEEDGAIFCLAAHPTRAEFLTGAENGVVRRHWLEDGSSTVLTRHADTVVYEVAYDSSGRHVTSVAFDKTVRLVDLESGRTSELLGHGRPVRCVAFSSDGRFLVTGSDDWTVRLWDPRESTATGVHAGLDQLVSAVAIDPSGRYLAVGSHFSGSLEVLDRDTGRVEATVLGTSDPINDLAFSPDGRWLAAAYEESASVRLYTSSGLRPVRTLLGHEASITSLAFHPGGGEIATASTDFTLRLWSVDTGQLLRVLTSHQAAALEVSFDPAGSTLAAAYADGVVLLWDADTGEPLRRCEGHLGGAHSLAWSHDGSRLAVGAGDGQVHVWSPEGDAPIAMLAGHDERISAVAFSPDGSRIVSGSHDASVGIWDASEGRRLLSLRGHAAPVSSVAFSPDGEEIVSGSFDNTVRVWSAEGTWPTSTAKVETPAARGGVEGGVEEPVGSPPTALAVLVNPKNPVVNLTLDELRSYFKLDRQFWVSRERCELFLRPSKSVEMEILHEKVYRMSPEELRKFWVGKVFRGEIRAKPSVVPTAEGARARVLKVAGALTVVRADEVPAGVRVLTIDGKGPRDQGYPLQ